VTPGGSAGTVAAPAIDPAHWYRSTDGASFVFRHLADAERFAETV
jgi:hypothetical protein